MALAWLIVRAASKNGARARDSGQLILFQPVDKTRKADITLHQRGSSDDTHSHIYIYI